MNLELIFWISIGISRAWFVLEISATGEFV